MHTLSANTKFVRIINTLVHEKSMQKVKIPLEKQQKCGISIVGGKNDKSERLCKA